MRERFTYANVVSTVALCLAVGGGSAYAGATLAKNSVKSPQIATGAVGSSEVRDGSVTLKDLAKDVKGGGSGAAGAAGLRGPEGPAGPPGPAGAQGPAGANLSFDGVRVGPLTRFEPVGSSASGSTPIPLGQFEDLSVEGYCFIPAGLSTPATEVRVRSAAGAQTAVVLGAPTNPATLLPNSFVRVEMYENPQPIVEQWGATVSIPGGATYDLRGIVIHQGLGGTQLLPPSGQACGLMEAGIERVSR